ncbi:M48 family metallopeptidase [Sulfurovum sp.]|uniref:M48 family metallopeptidase n=1 Tax=Sulfurovum sp. TaxID=1969726 RepID=UPI0025DC389B|nr:SprT family zinc-dependent metalloprotease [Sulfurovum sp.]
MGLLPQYRHIVNPRLKHTYLTFDHEGNLIIKSPKVSQHYIEQLLIKKSVWINKSKEKLMQKKGKALDFSKQTELYFQGSAYPLLLQKQTKKRTKLTFENGLFVLYYYRYDETLFQKHIDRFYKEEASQFIPPLLRHWACEMKLSPNNISFRKTKRQWGSCSSKNNLSFNTMVMKLPLDVIQYIIIHELAHIKHKHHQKSFWALVEHYMPNYRQHVSELKTYSTV